MPSRYKNIKGFLTAKGKRYKTNAVYPTIPYGEDDIYILTTVGDRYDQLAQQFYGDSSLWWIIAMANNSKKDGLLVEPGIQLRVPDNHQQIVRNYIDLNANR